MADLTVRLAAPATALASCEDAALIVMKQKGVRLHRTADKDREWLVKLNSSVTAACTHKFGSVVASSRYVAVLDEEHLVTWGAGFDKALHLASGTHLGHNVSHVLAPQHGAKPFHNTQGVLIVGAGTLFVFNPYTTEIAGPLAGLDAADGAVVFAAAGCEREDETFFAYIVTANAPETLKVLRVVPRSYSVEVVGTHALPKGTCALHLLRDNHWVAVTTEGKVLESPVRDPTSAEGRAGLFKWSSLTLSLDADAAKALAGQQLGTAAVAVGATDPHVVGVAMASANPARLYSGVRIVTVDVRYLAVLEDATPLEEPDAATASAAARPGALAYTASPGVHWVALGEDVFACTAVVGARTLAGAMKAQGHGAAATKAAAPIVFKVTLPSAKTAAAREESIAAAFKKGAQVAVEAAKKPIAAPAKEAEAAKALATPATAQAIYASAGAAAAYVKASVTKKWWKVLDTLLKAAEGGHLVLADRESLVTLAKTAADKKATAGDRRAAAVAFRRLAKAHCAPLPATAYGEIAYALLKDEQAGKDAVKGTYAMLDALFGRAAPLPSELEAAVALADALPDSARTRLLRYLYVRLVVRVGAGDASKLDRAGVPSPRVLTFFTAAVVEGGAEDITAASPAYVDVMMKAASLAHYVASITPLVIPLSGQLTALIGTHDARSANPPDIDSKDYLLRPLRCQDTHQPVERHTVVL